MQVVKAMKMDEERLKTCCFTGHRPVKLMAAEKDIRQWLGKQIDKAVSDGYQNFITGCAMGVDIWAGEIVLQKQRENPAVRLIAANPWPEMAKRWSPDWQKKHMDLLSRADEVVTICDHYHKCVYKQRNIWMADHSNRLIAYYNGSPGGTRNTILYAKKCGLEVVQYGIDP